jgi:hypothetical protein
MRELGYGYTWKLLAQGEQTAYIKVTVAVQAIVHSYHSGVKVRSEEVIGTRKTPRRHVAQKRNLAAYSYSAHPYVLML